VTLPSTRVDRVSMIFSFSHYHIGMVIHARQNTAFRRDRHCIFIDRYSITPCQYFSCPSGMQQCIHEKYMGFLADVPRKEEYFHG
jgi:hypothetical protein